MVSFIMRSRSYIFWKQSLTTLISGVSISLIFCALYAQSESKNSQTTKSVILQETNTISLGDVLIDPVKKRVTIPSFVNMAEGQIEYLLVGRSGKRHESLLYTDVRPYIINTAMLLLNLKGAQNKYPDDISAPIPGDRVRIKLIFNNEPQKIYNAEDFIVNIEKEKPMQPGDWIYNGSRIIDGTYIAERDQSIISIKRDIDAIFNHPQGCMENENNWIINTNQPIKIGTPLKVIIEIATELIDDDKQKIK